MDAYDIAKWMLVVIRIKSGHAVNCYHDLRSAGNGKRGCQGSPAIGLRIARGLVRNDR